MRANEKGELKSEDSPDVNRLSKCSQKFTDHGEKFKTGMRNDS